MLTIPQRPSSQPKPSGCWLYYRVEQKRKIADKVREKKSSGKENEKERKLAWRRSKAASAASIPDFIAVCAPLIFTAFKNPAAQPSSAPPGNVRRGRAWYPPSFSVLAPYAMHSPPSSCAATWGWCLYRWNSLYLSRDGSVGGRVPWAEQMREGDSVGPYACTVMALRIRTS